MRMHSAGLHGKTGPIETGTECPAHPDKPGRLRQIHRLTRRTVTSAWLVRALQSAALLALSGAAVAHDTWFAPLPTPIKGEAAFALGTGNQFPKQEFTIPWQQLRTTGCRGAGPQSTTMRWVEDLPHAVVLRSGRPLVPAAALTCWAQLRAVDIELDDTTVEIYLKEVNALPAVRERWAALRARGVRWQETYTKHARIEVAAVGGIVAHDAGAESAPIEGLDMDIRIESPLPLRAGDTLRAQLLRDGQPLHGQPVELRSDISPLGLWRKTDADGRLQITVPQAAHWLLRATDLRPAPGQAERWESRFVTLAFEVLPRR